MRFKIKKYLVSGKIDYVVFKEDVEYYGLFCEERKVLYPIDRNWDVIDSHIGDAACFNTLKEAENFIEDIAF